MPIDFQRFCYFSPIYDYKYSQVISLPQQEAIQAILNMNCYWYSVDYFRTFRSDAPELLNQFQEVHDWLTDRDNGNPTVANHHLGDIEKNFYKAHYSFFVEIWDNNGSVHTHFPRLSTRSLIAFAEGIADASRETQEKGQKDLALIAASQFFDPKNGTHLIRLYKQALLQLEEDKDAAVPALFSNPFLPEAIKLINENRDLPVSWILQIIA